MRPEAVTARPVGFGTPTSVRFRTPVPLNTETVLTAKFDTRISALTGWMATSHGPDSPVSVLSSLRSAAPGSNTDTWLLGAPNPATYTLPDASTASPPPRTGIVRTEEGMTSEGTGTAATGLAPRRPALRLTARQRPYDSLDVLSCFEVTRG